MFIRKAKGIVLIIVLVYMQCLALMSIYTLTHYQLQLRLSSQAQLRTRMLQATEALLKPSATLFLEDCPIAKTAWQSLWRQSVAWWQAQACAGNFQDFRYYYVVETLANDPCASVTETLTARYYRLSLRVIAQQDANMKVIVQTTWVAGEKATAVCQGIRHSVPSGRQMWRELS